MTIPFNRPSFVGHEREYMEAALANGHISGDGKFSAACSRILAEVVGGHRVLLTTSGTHALEMAAMLLSPAAGAAPEEPQAEVIVPAFTFTSTANAFLVHGMRPVFADIRPDTLNIDETDLERVLSERTRAVSVVHYAGVGCDMEPIQRFCTKHGLSLVEDNAHGLFGTHLGRPLGSFGRFAALSFHETKNITCGEGGALIVRDAADVERAEYIREKGTNRSQFFRGAVDKYTWVDVGSSYLPSDLLAAILYAQLEARETIQARRHAIWERYFVELAPWARTNEVALPVVPDSCRHPAHMFHLVMPTAAARDGLIAHLRQLGIGAVFHYIPLDTSPVGQRLGVVPGMCPVAASVSERLVRLPFFYELLGEDLDTVIAAVTRFAV